MERWEEDEQEIARLQEKLTEAEAALAVYEEAHRKVKESFKHKAGGKCACPYCTRNVEALEIHAAEQELKWLEEHTKVLDLQKQVAELEQLKEKPKVVGVLKCQWCEKEFTSETLFIEHLQMHLSATTPKPGQASPYGVAKDFEELFKRYAEFNPKRPKGPYDDLLRLTPRVKDPDYREAYGNLQKDALEDLRKHYHEQMSAKEKENIQLKAIQEQIYKAQEEVAKRHASLQEKWWKELDR